MASTAPSSTSKTTTWRGVPCAARQAPGIQAPDGMDLPLGILARQRLQLRLQHLVHRGAAARGHRRIQLPVDGREAGPGSRRRPSRRNRGHGRDRRGHVHTGGPRYERVRPRGRRRVPHLFRLRPRRRRALGHVPVAGPSTEGTQRDRAVVPPPRRVRQWPDGEEKLMSVRYPGESAEYRAARDRLLEQEIELRRAMEAVAAARRGLPPGGVVPEDYVFTGRGGDGNATDVSLSELFAPGKDSLMIYSFM